MLYGVVRLDLQNAFDTVKNSILLNQLRWLGADEISVKLHWFRCYLTCRALVIDIGGTMSETKGITVEYRKVRYLVLYYSYCMSMIWHMQ